MCLRIDQNVNENCIAIAKKNPNDLFSDAQIELVAGNKFAVPLICHRFGNHMKF